ncbi:hypothetical protein [Zhongshania arctica]|uniref:Uncharacterized protein n=1 Tax=Zhongshania arctica TaxID=3238302 RepID=A0ABV3TXM2_9GAMM
MKQQGKLDIDFSDTQYQKILNGIQSDTSPLLCVGLIKIADGQRISAQSNSENVNKPGEVWLSLADTFFGDGSQTMTDLPEAAQIIALRFNKDYFVGLRHETVQKNVAALLRDENHLGPASRDVKLRIHSHTDAISQSPGDYVCLDRSGVRVGSELVNTGTAGQLCSSDECANAILQNFLVDGCIPSLTPLLSENNIDASTLNEVYFESEKHKVLYKRVRFLPDYIFIMASQTEISVEQFYLKMRNCSDNILRYHIEKILAAGIHTDLSLAQDDQSWQHIVQALREQDDEDLLGLLETGGFANHSIGGTNNDDHGDIVLRCAECIYYYPNRKWCDLPELPVPVEPHWYCKLWKL